MYKKVLKRFIDIVLSGIGIVAVSYTHLILRGTLIF